MSPDVARTNSGPGQRARLVCQPALILVFAVTTLLAPACGPDTGGPMVASGGSATTRRSLSSAATSSNAALAGSSPSELVFPYCMRTHGVANFPDQATGGKYPTRYLIFTCFLYEPLRPFAPQAKTSFDIITVMRATDRAGYGARGSTIHTATTTLTVTTH